MSDIAGQIPRSLPKSIAAPCGPAPSDGSGYTRQSSAPAPLRLGGVGMILGEGGGDEGRDDAPAAPAGMGERVAHEVHPAALPSGAEHARDGGLDALVRIRDHQVDAGGPRRLSRRRKSTQKVSASEAPIAMPRTSRRPSVLTATAMVTATETIRPASRTFT